MPPTEPPAEVRNAPPSVAENLEREDRALLGAFHRLGDRMTKREAETQQAGRDIEKLARELLAAEYLPAVRAKLERIVSVALDLQIPF